MTHSETAFFWIASLFGGLTAVTARVTYHLYGIAAEPPSDPEALVHWRRKRRWLAISEFSALPFFTSAAMAVQIYLELPQVASILITMIFGAVGIGMFLNGIELVFKRKLKLEGPE